MPAEKTKKCEAEYKPRTVAHGTPAGSTREGYNQRLITNVPSQVVSISKSDVERVARLARIGIEPHEAERYSIDLSNILTLVEQMNKIDTEGIQPMAHPQDIQLRLRDDEVKEVNKRDQFQAIAPAVKQGLYLVPKVID